MTTIQTNLDTLLSRLQKVKQDKPNHWMSLCPGHQDHNRSLSVTVAHDKILLNCLAGCETSVILRAIDLDFRNLFSKERSYSIEVERYGYTDEYSRSLYWTVRYLPKDFRQCRPNGKGGVIWNLDGVPRVLYSLPNTLTAKHSGETIFVPEGERDVDNIWLKAICPATCSPLGAGKWKAEYYVPSLAGAKHIVVIPDSDHGNYSLAGE